MNYSKIVLFEIFSSKQIENLKFWDLGTMYVYVYVYRFSLSRCDIFGKSNPLPSIAELAYMAITDES